MALPDSLEAPNRDNSFQVNPTGQLADVAVDGGIQANRFTPRMDKPGVRVSRLVTGVCQHPWAEVHRVPVERKKRVEERDHVLRPAVYGQWENAAFPPLGTERAWKVVEA